MSQIQKSSGPISLPFTRDSVIQVLDWGADAKNSPYSHKKIAEWCDRFWCKYIDLDASPEIEKLLPILTDVETQWDLFLANSFSIEELKSRSFDEVELPHEWFVEWLMQATNLMKWDQVKGDFKIDGSLRDIYVNGATHDSWQKFLEFIVKQRYKIKFISDGKDLKLPQKIEDVLELRNQHQPTLCVWLNDAIQVNCHFFLTQTDPDPLELDIDPKDIQSEQAFASLSDFLVRLQSAVSKPVVITHENSPDLVIVSYR